MMTNLFDLPDMNEEIIVPELQTAEIPTIEISFLGSNESLEIEIPGFRSYDDFISFVDKNSIESSPFVSNVWNCYEDDSFDPYDILYSRAVFYRILEEYNAG